LRATRWLDQNQRVEGMTWCPGQPMLIKDRLVVHGGWIERKGVTSSQLYRPPRAPAGQRRRRQTLDRPRLPDSVRRMAVTASNQMAGALRAAPRRERSITRWCWWRAGDRQGQLARASQRGGSLEFPRSVTDAPARLSSNSFAKSVILRVNEGRDLGDIDRFKFYDHKRYTATPPDAAGRRKAPARTLRVQRPRLHHHHQPQD
jgi:hypothetical protein